MSTSVNNISFECTENQVCRYFHDRPEVQICDAPQKVGEALAEVLLHVHAIAQGGPVSRYTIESLTAAYNRMIKAASKDQEENG